MKNLLELALEAHGGLTRWSQLKAVTADLSVTGALWQIKGQAGVLQQIRIEAEPHGQELTSISTARTNAQRSRRIPSLCRPKVEGCFRAVRILVRHFPVSPELAMG